METTDAVSRLLHHVGLRAHTFYAGSLCGLHDFDAAEGTGHLHIVRAGILRATQRARAPIAITEPTLLFYPRPLRHRLDVAEGVTAEVLCASVRYDAGLDNAITQSLPEVVLAPLRQAPGLEPTLGLLFDEAGAARTGRQVLLDRLCDVLLIQIVRFAVEHGMVGQGFLAGLSHPRLARLLTELLDAPGDPWSLETMAARTHLSRTAFARLFKEVMGTGPAAFLAQLRLGVAQRLLRQGQPLTHVAEAVGYGSQPAFSRAFIRETGVAPSEWLRREAEG